MSSAPSARLKAEFEKLLIVTKAGPPIKSASPVMLIFHPSIWPEEFVGNANELGTETYITQVVA